MLDLLGNDVPEMPPVPKSIHDVHYASHTVYYDDTDMSGRVYHPRFLSILDRARAELLGISAIEGVRTGMALEFAVHKTELELVGPAMFGDELLVATELLKMTQYKLVFAQSIRQNLGGSAVASANTRVVCLGRNGRPAPIPQRALHQAWLECHGEARDSRRMT